MRRRRNLDTMKDILVYGTQTTQRGLVRIITVVAKIEGFRIWGFDVKLAYL